ncbi:alpha/beta fold hydrolase [Aliterella atlantica]|uniref:Alpha/beta hydrolase n=1 Tax=Aliterella atlantica CENA595 TaxID=1618023 RepID=A0A0D8ZT47_9CYAN|nr:alpha/beta hydrolase [Aliterella atlantica]KJH71659.1 alpha/beta hydrolase [Aliterella atlantica CENA595]
MQDWWQATFPQGRQTVEITDANGYQVSIAYGEKGQGQPLILIHGIASWGYSWRHCIHPLSQYFRVICFDAKGYGFSEKVNYPEKAGHQVIELERIIRALCDRPAIIVAESLGALIALAVVQAHPELCERLIIMNVPVFPTQLPSQGMRLLSLIPIQLIQLVDFLRLTYLFAPLIRAIAQYERQDVLSDDIKSAPDEIYWLTYPYIEFPGAIAKLTEEMQLSAREIEKLLQNQPNHISDIQAQLGNIKCPTLILWSDGDRWFPSSDGEKLRDRLPNSQLQILENCGHSASSSCPEAVNTAILGFLSN